MPPLPSLQWLNTLKSTQLKSLAAAIGANSSGTKPTLISTLQSHLSIGLFSPQPGLSDKTKDSRSKHEIISIDMGIRNLAYCRISLPFTWPPGSSSSPQYPNSTFSSSVPTITEWARIAISSKPDIAFSIPTHKNNAINENNTSSSASSPPKKEPFDPCTFARHAYNLANHLILHQHPHSQPTQIIIERQRFRSMGGSAVQEWTLRVNLFEAMIYAVLETLAEVGRWTGGAAGRAVHAVEPGKVARFWLSSNGDLDRMEEEVEKTKTGEKKGLTKGARSKLAKIKVVEEWLEEVLSRKEGGRFKLEGNARALGEGFLRKRKGGRDVRVSQESVGESRIEEADIGKLDDLADSLLQGMAWVKWEENRRRILGGGIDALSSLS